MRDKTAESVQRQYKLAEEYIAVLRQEAAGDSDNVADRYHLGKILHHVMKKHPHAINQIDAYSGISETNESVLTRSVKLATALKDYGLKVGDVIAVMSPHHLDLCIPLFAAQFLGVTLMPWPEISSTDDLEHYLTLSEAKIVFCQHEHTEKLVLLRNKFNFKIVTFDKNGDHETFQGFIEKHSSEDKCDEFAVADLDPYETNALLLSTSGSTGRPKIVMLTQANVTHQLPVFWNNDVMPPATKLLLVWSPLQWVATVVLYILGTVFVVPRVQTVEKLTPDLIVDIINKYKPSLIILSAGLSKMLLESPKKCDVSCFTGWWLGGTNISMETITQAQKYLGRAVANAYGTSETFGLVTYTNYTPENGSIGVITSTLQYKLVNIDTHIEAPIGEIGELWVKGPNVFKGYLKNPVATSEAMTPDGWLRTGDLMRQDHEGYLYFYERVKLMIRCMDPAATNVTNMNQSFPPGEIEAVIRQLEGVEDVVVTSVDGAPSVGELPVAVIIRTPGHHVTAARVKQHVKDNLPWVKQLRGGVVFLDQFPLTATSKLDRRETKRIVSTMPLE